MGANSLILFLLFLLLRSNQSNHPANPPRPPTFLLNLYWLVDCPDVPRNIDYYDSMAAVTRIPVGVSYLNPIPNSEYFPSRVSSFFDGGGFWPWLGRLALDLRCFWNVFALTQVDALFRTAHGREVKLLLIVFFHGESYHSLIIDSRRRMNV